MMTSVFGVIALAVLLLVLFFALLESSLRWGLGLGHPVLYVADPTMGYRLRPNQHLRRLGRRIVINADSLRGEAIAPQCPPDTTRLLLLGDSVANGNWWTDQSQILSQLLQNDLVRQEQFATVEVLNASANSWGPRNELAYVQRFGTFGSRWVLLLLNTDDLFATAPTSLQVGRDRNYPDRNPPLALVELYEYYLRKPRPIPGLKAIQKAGGDRVGQNLAAIATLQRLCSEQQAQLLIALSPLRREVQPGQPRDYEQVARQRLHDLAVELAIPYLDLLPAFDQMGAALYRDHIHLSPQGNQLVSQVLAEWIQTLEVR
ncbi:MAG: SGNH/GDSL hydrolase family protein [Cyanobacteria bacterium P01_G01_bin.54]